MFKYKLLKIIIASLSLLSFLASVLSDYIKDKTLKRYDLRWHHAVDQKNRVHTVTVRNAGSDPRDNLVVELNLGPDAGNLTDFAVASDESGPSERFLYAIERAQAGQAAGALTTAEISKLSQLLDRHSSDRGLDDLDRTLDQILKDRLEAANGSKGSSYFKANTEQTSNWHVDWYHKCASKPNADCDRIDSVFADWEKARIAFHTAAIENWQQRTKMGLVSESDHMSLNNKLLLTLSLAPNEHRILKFHYAHDPATIATTFRSTTGKQTYQLRNTREVFSSFVRVLFTLQPMWFVMVIVVAVALVKYGPLLLPLHIMPVYKVFNFALESKDEDYWKHALERHRYFILRQLRSLKNNEKSPTAISEQEILDYVRDWLTVREERGLPRFRNGKSLNRSIHNELWRLVRVTR